MQENYSFEVVERQSTLLSNGNKFDGETNFGEPRTKREIDADILTAILGHRETRVGPMAKGPSPGPWVLPGPGESVRPGCGPLPTCLRGGGARDA